MQIIHNKEFEVKIYYLCQGDELAMLDEQTKAYAEDQGFEGKAKDHFIDLGPNSSKTILIGLGQRDKLTTQCFRNAGFEAGNILNSNRVKEASLIITSQDGHQEKSVGQCSVEGLLHSTYAFDWYLQDSEKAKRYVESIGILSDECDQAAIDEAADITRGNHIARDLVNIPANDLYPETLANKAIEILEEVGVKVTIFDKDQIQEMGMEAYLAVGQGSDRDPKFILIEYLPQGQEEPAITLVGKGMTYDSGGYAIKPAKSMSYMKCDMAGAASVIGAIYSLAKQGIKKNVVGIVAACENMISGRAYKNGDIVGSMKGLYIEVGNTDAEGRLTLADALYYGATQVNSECIIDMATLTGACVRALGERIIGGFTNNQELLDAIMDVGVMTGEEIWQLPINDDIRNQIKGSVGDLKNSTSDGPGASTAAAFLEHFVEDKPWVHLDIAGPAWSSEKYGYLPSGGTGVPVKTLYNFVKRQA